VYVLQAKGVHLFDADGRLVKRGFITAPQIPGTSGGANGTIRVDRKGCVYLLSTMKPIGAGIPDELVGRLPPVERRPSLPFVYRHMYGSVVKFGPQGGRVTPDKKGTIDWCVYNAGNVRCRAEGLIWYRFGVSPVRYRNVEYLPCSCEAPRFDLDAFGRVFIPDALRFQVEIVDANANPILRVGRYGNMDDDVTHKGDKRNPALAWPVVVEVREDDLYVMDRLNKRIVKLNLKYEVEQRSTVTVTGGRE